jgi:hypothetical protein
VYPMLPVSLDCVCFVFLLLVYHMLPDSLVCTLYGLFATMCHRNNCSWTF